MSDAEKEKGSILEVLSQWLLVPIAVFSYYSANRSYFEWLNPLPTLALGLAGMALIHLVLGRFQKDRTKTALICTLLGMAFFSPCPWSTSWFPMPARASTASQPNGVRS